MQMPGQMPLMQDEECYLLSVVKSTSFNLAEAQWDAGVCQSPVSQQSQGVAFMPGPFTAYSVELCQGPNCSVRERLDSWLLYPGERSML